MMNGDVKLIMGKLEANNTTIFKAIDGINKKLDENGKLLNQYVRIVDDIKKSCEQHRKSSEKKEMMLFGFELKTVYTVIVLIVAYLLGMLNSGGTIMNFALRLFGGN